MENKEDPDWLEPRQKFTTSDQELDSVFKKLCVDKKTKWRRRTSSGSRITLQTMKNQSTNRPTRSKSKSMSASILQAPKLVLASSNDAKSKQSDVIGSELPKPEEPASAAADDNNSSCIPARTCGSQHTAVSTCFPAAVRRSPTLDDTTPDELAAYFEQLLHIPKPMSSMAEMMYA